MQLILNLSLTFLREPIYKNHYSLSSTENAPIRHLLITIPRAVQRRRGIDNMAAVETQSIKRASSSKPRRYQTNINLNERKKQITSADTLYGIPHQRCDTSAGMFSAHDSFPEQRQNRKCAPSAQFFCCSSYAAVIVT